MAWFYFAWITATILIYIGSAHASLYSNTHDGWKSWAYLYAFNFYPGWLIVARYSKNLVFDAFLYDLIMFMSFSIALAIFSNSQTTLTSTQWLGIVIVIVGMVLIKS